MQNSKKGEPDKYRKERDEAVEKYSKLKEKYSKLETECIDLKDQITESKKQERYAKQHAALTERQREGFIFDMDEELAFVGKFGDEDADHHINVRIPEKYNKVPTGDVPLSEWSETENKFAKKSPAEKYSKAAYAATPVLRGQNQQVDYASTLKAMCAKDSEDVTLQDVLAVQNGI